MSANQKANYVIFEDGYDANVWQTIGEPDELNRNRVHNRWVEDCIQHNQIFDCSNAYHLIPLPKSVPVQAFEKIGIAFTCYTTAVDQLIFGRLAALYGF